jgi:DNA-binding MarR family transcriptional regulator
MVTAAPREDPAPARPPWEESGCLAGAEGLIELSRLVQAAFTRVAASHDLTPVQGRLLCVLAQAPRGMAELARAFGVERAALTGLIDRAERRGLVERRAVPGDRRAVSVSLTPDGSNASARFHAAVTAELLRLLAPLAPAERAAFRAALAAITGAGADNRLVGGPGRPGEAGGRSPFPG